MKRCAASKISDIARRRSVIAKAPEETPSSSTRWISTAPAPGACARWDGLGERLDQKVEHGGVVVELAAIVAVNGDQHALELVVRRIGAVRGLAQAGFERPQPARTTSSSNAVFDEK